MAGEPGVPNQQLDVREMLAASVTAAEIEALTDFHNRLLRELDPADRPVEPAWVRHWFHPGSETARRRAILAIEDNKVVGRAMHVLPMRSNTHVLDLKIEVDPAARRRGIGTELLRFALTIAAEEGRTSVAAWGVRSLSQLAFWESFGAPEVHPDGINRLELGNVDPQLIAKWQSESRARHDGYVLHRWKGLCPEDLRDAYVAALSGMADAPMDELEMDPPLLDEAWLIDVERKSAELNRDTWAILALSPEGEPAGMTDVMLNHDRPSLILQGGTTTLDEHRRRGLGRWMKAEMIAWLQDEWPAGTTIETGNADSNRAMLEINHELGFYSYAQLTTRQIETADLISALARRDGGKA